MDVGKVLEAVADSDASVRSYSSECLDLHKIIFLHCNHNSSYMIITISGLKSLKFFINKC